MRSNGVENLRTLWHRFRDANDDIDEENETKMGDYLGLLHGPCAPLFHGMSHRALLRLNFSSLRPSPTLGWKPKFLSNQKEVEKVGHVKRKKKWAPRDNKVVWATSLLCDTWQLQERETLESNG
ncbi:unnamed protein product [Prunus armeniaca]|uniref:Uncharacterized protein n=1 Tax=Prunus armeniaca TaxID=36596 RepID=A0A6J5U277_PRUAR|nr:unnamed protein product [Prunus armeniaca]CAB4299085.1 unnamed protein product [Prunus armeniaca]